MNENIAISLKNVTKTYRLYDNHADRVKETFHPFRKKYHHPFNALTNISIDMRKGETLGIIGQNGSGKSTLLQIICGILQPTSGSVEVNGRVSALLELGAGFNPEFTGRQNVYINAGILGLTHEEIEARFDDIAAFADIGDFIDQPVKSYSSGMYARLAFSVAIHVDPDILIVDEVLSVGDFAFQFKCFRRLQELSNAGCTVLFVTHDIEQVRKLCKHTLYLRKGQVILLGDVKSTCDRYLAEVWVGTENAPPSIELENQYIGNATAQPVVPSAYKAFAERVELFRRGNRYEAEILHVSVNGCDLKEHRITFGDKISVRVVFRFKLKLEQPIIAIYVTDENGQLIIGTSSVLERINLSHCEPGETYALTLAFENRLREGRFALQIYLANIVGGVRTDYIDYLEMAIPFQSVSPPDIQHWAWFTPPFSTNLELVTEAAP